MWGGPPGPQPTPRSACLKPSASAGAGIREEPLIHRGESGAYRAGGKADEYRSSNGLGERGPPHYRRRDRTAGGSHNFPFLCRAPRAVRLCCFQIMDLAKIRLLTEDDAEAFWK